jgi:hypothetical protein
MEEGRQYIVKSRQGHGSGYVTGAHPPYPGFSHGRKVEVIKEYPNFFLCTVLPRVTELGITTPYNLTIDKFDVGRLWDVKPC